MNFLGRSKEIQTLNALWRKNVASLVVISGRRRVGKSRLVEHFAKGGKFYNFSGLYPSPQTTAQSQRDEFGQQLANHFDLPHIVSPDWTELFNYLAKQTQKQKCVILLDEISWMGSKDPDFLGKLKIAWDMKFKKNNKLILVLCGSVSSWIEQNILKSPNFMGRVSLPLALKELPLSVCNKLIDATGGKYSTYEKFIFLSIFGGIPRYFEEIKPELSAIDNIKALCFSSSGFLVSEFDDIFSDVFGAKSKTYQNIVESLQNGPQEYQEICKKLNMEKSGYLLNTLTNLQKAGFVSRDYTWHLKNGELSRLSQYRLSDNYIRFYLKYIKKNKAKINNDYFDNISLLSFSGIEAILGLQFENLVLNNRHNLLKLLNISPETIVVDNPYFQRKTTRVKGCQIDYLIQTKHKILYLCEIRFRTKPISSNIVEEMSKKINALNVPPGFTVRTVLIQVNGITKSLRESQYFTHIIDFCQCL